MELASSSLLPRRALHPTQGGTPCAGNGIWRLEYCALRLFGLVYSL